jgi:hypothetical protein
MMSNFDRLIEEICVKWGYCGCFKLDTSIHVALFIPSHGPVNVDQFVDWVLLADDVNPNVASVNSVKIREGIHSAFIRHMGSETVDATQLK